MRDFWNRESGIGNREVGIRNGMGLMRAMEGEGRDTLEAVEDPDLVECLERGGESAMDTEHGIIDHDTDGEVVEQVSEVSPHIRRPVLALAFHVKSIHLGGIASFVIFIGCKKKQEEARKNGGLGNRAKGKGVKGFPYLCDSARLVVAPDEIDPVGIPEFEETEEGDGLDAVVSAVDVIPEKEVIGRRHEPAHVEQLDDVIELTVNIADDSDRG